jgi:DeoR/GlpR family transcriptional regulator of sugar metabolism
VQYRKILCNIMLTRQRKQHLLDILRRDGQVVAKRVSAELDLSEDTIRRDLRELAAEGRLQRVHGGALPASPGVADLAHRRAISAGAKARIGRAAAGMIGPGQVVVLDGGTTAVEAARHLAPDLKATIVTHSPSVAVELERHPGVEVLLIGGRLFKHSMVATGAIAIEAISRLRADLYFMGVTGVHPTEGLTTGDVEEAAVKRALMGRAAETIVMASNEKLGAVSPYLVAPVAEISGVILEESAPADVVKAIEQQGVTVTRA